MLNRRTLLTGLGASSLALSLPANAFSYAGGLRATELGLRPGSAENQGRTLQAILEQASAQNQPVLIDPGTYRVGDVTLPANTRISGIKGATTLEFAGGSHFIYGENCNTVELRGLTFDGRVLPVREYADGSVRITNAKQVSIRDCRSTNSSAYGLFINESDGVISNNVIDNSLGFAGIMGLANKGLTISENTIEDCANGGILVNRWQRKEDSTIVTGNRIRRIAAVKGGTGPHGNGINTYQCDGVMVTDNHISDCAFSTIRSNSCNNIQISDNTCIRAGETSIYSEFAFQGANISGNIVDGAARGISIANMDHGGRLSICANNLVRNIHDTVPYDPENHIFGAGILAEADIAITGNVIENTKRFGMLLGWGPYLRNVVASNNMIRDTRTGFYLSVVEGIGSVSLTDNIISKVTNGAIVGHRWNDAVTGDLAKSGSDAFPSLQITRNKLDS